MRQDYSVIGVERGERGMSHSETLLGGRSGATTDWVSGEGDGGTERGEGGCGWVTRNGGGREEKNGLGDRVPSILLNIFYFPSTLFNTG